MRTTHEADRTNLERRADDDRWLRHLLAIYERDRQLLAYEIHDGLIQSLTASAMYLEMLQSQAHQLPEGARDHLERSLQLVREGIREGRRLISGLRPPLLDEEGLVAAIDDLIERHAMPQGPKVEFRHNLGAATLSPLVELTAYRVVQEALSNVRRHSRATRAWVELEASDQCIHLSIHDNGGGFDPSKVGSRQYGLRGIRERAALMGGSAEIESGSGRGTRIRVELPRTLPGECEAR